MREQRILLKYRGQNRELTLKVCNWFGKFFGLMFRRKKDAEALLFEFKRPSRVRIHSLFVFFPFVAIWMDEKGEILSKKVVTSWKFSVKAPEKFTKLIEIPCNKKYLEIVRFLVGSRKSLKRD